MPELIYCADGNRRFAEIAISCGYTYGAQVPNTVYFKPEFCDQAWKKPNRLRYMEALECYRPRMATVLDLERYDQLTEILEWGEEASAFVETIIIIPKAQGIVAQLPRVIGSKPVRLGYSVPTSFGGTSLGLWEFIGWPVHLLGGSPSNQMRLTQYLDVQSADGNYAGLKARKFCQYFDGKRWRQLASTGDTERNDAIYRAFEISCRNIMAAWLTAERREEGRTYPPSPCQGSARASG